jgi:hypothetical protein
MITGGLLLEAIPLPRAIQLLLVKYREMREIPPRAQSG